MGHEIVPQHEMEIQSALSIMGGRRGTYSVKYRLANIGPQDRIR